MSYMNPVTDQELLIYEHESNLYIYNCLKKEML